MRSLPSPALLVVASLALACDNEPETNFGSVSQPWEIDEDGDGFTANVDCDDTEAGSTPDGTEICDGIDNDCDGLTDEDGTQDALTWYLDEDGDGHGAGQGFVKCYPEDGYSPFDDDCDDTDDNRYPGNTETCDNIDEDCDNVADNNAADPDIWYADLDRDGYGDPDNTRYACDQPTGYQEYGTDCEDRNAGINPAAEELCDGMDNDCDDRVDELAVTVYQDADGDGYGDPDVEITTCDGEEGTVSDDTDCDDADASVYPGATESSDGLDNDCDGEVDEGTTSTDDDGDGFAEADGDCDDTDASVGPDMDEVCGDGVDQNCNGETDGCELLGDVAASDADAVLVGAAAEDHAGDWIATAGDLDGDGIGDLLVAAPQADGGGAEGGAAYVVFGPVSGSIALGDEETRFDGEAGDQAGTGSIGPGDLDGDGFDDLVISASGSDASASDAGAAWVLLGPVGGELSASDADGGLLGATASDALGSGVANLGDADGDGWTELLVGMKGDATVATNAGGAVVLPAPFDGAVDAGSATATLLGEARGDNAGAVVAGGGDMDGDGVWDLAVASPYSDAAGSNSGAAYALRGPVSGTLSLGEADATIEGELAGDLAGTGLAWGGDLDGDGRDDLVIGAPYADVSATDAGAIYALFGPVSGAIGLADADLRVPGLVAKDRAGQAVCSAGDLDQDGSDDLLVTAFYEDTAERNAGAAYLFYGPLSSGLTLDAADARLLGEAEDDRLGGAVAGARDVDGDGAPDLLVGAHVSDLGATDGGAVYLFRGGGL